MRRPTTIGSSTDGCTSPAWNPREDGSLGNFYRLEDGRWVKHGTLPNSLHSTDIIGVDKSLFALSSREKPPMCLLESSDDGKTWKMYDMPSLWLKAGQR